MPYLRIYSHPLSLAQKREISQTLMTLMSRIFELDQAHRHEVNIQFVLIPRVSSVTGFGHEVGADTDVFVEWKDHALPPEKVATFTAEAEPMLAALLSGRSRWWNKLVGRKAEPHHVALLFSEIKTDPMVRESIGDLERRAA